MKTKKKLREFIINKALLYVILVALIIFITVYISFEVKESGWTSEIIITIFYSIITSTLGISFYELLSKYLIKNNKKIRHLNNNLNQLLDYFTRREKLHNLEQHFINEENVERVSLIKDILMKYVDVSNINSVDDLDCLVDKYGNLKSQNYKFKFSTKETVKIIYLRIKENRSDDFDYLYLRYKSGELVKIPKSHLFDLFLPLTATIVGLFAAIYQILGESGVLSTAFFQYVRVFASFTVFMGMFALLSANYGIPCEEKKIAKYINKIKLSMDSGEKNNDCFRVVDD